MVPRKRGPYFALLTLEFSLFLKIPLGLLVSLSCQNLALYLTLLPDCFCVAGQVLTIGTGRRTGTVRVFTRGGGLPWFCERPFIGDGDLGFTVNQNSETPFVPVQIVVANTVYLTKLSLISGQVLP